jgi:acetyl esterase/lipase
VNARKGPGRPAILHTHGGGYVLGEARGDVRSLQETAKALDCVCVSVDYRLAPETHWQGSTADNYAGLKWLHDHAQELGADRARIAVMGESAGGGHAALLALRARDCGEVPIVLQVLVYPMLDDRTGTSRPVPAHLGSSMWNSASNRYGWQSFLGMEPGGNNVPVAAVPARVAELAGLPPTWIGVGSIDLFVEEDVEYARRLIVAGVRTELEVVPGAFHGFDIDTSATVAKQFRATKLNALRRAFGMPAVV